jgi:hypothetical protein
VLHVLSDAACVMQSIDQCSIEQPVHQHPPGAQVVSISCTGWLPRPPPGPPPVRGKEGSKRWVVLRKATLAVTAHGTCRTQRNAQQAKHSAGQCSADASPTGAAHKGHQQQETSHDTCAHAFKATRYQLQQHSCHQIHTCVLVTARSMCHSSPGRPWTR